MSIFKKYKIVDGGIWLSKEEVVKAIHREEVKLAASIVQKKRFYGRCEVLNNLLMHIEEFELENKDKK